MIMRQKLGVISLAFLIAAVPLSGCNSNKKASSGPNGSDVNAASTSSAQANSTADSPFGKYEEPLDVNFAGFIDDEMTKKVLVDGKTMEQNQWNDAYKNGLNINLKYKWISKSGDEAQQKMNVALASGDIPDILYLNSVQLSQAARAGIIEDLTPYIDKYASPEVKEHLSKIGDWKKAATFGGKIMAFPHLTDIAPELGFLWVRSDWLKNLNLQPPKTWADVRAVSKAFTTQDPDRDGKNDTYGLGLNKGYGSIEGVLNAFHVNSTIWAEKDGKLVNGGIQPEAKIALNELHEMFKAGEIDKEFGLKGDEKTAQDLANQRIGMMFAPFYATLHPLEESRKNDPNADWLPLLIPSSDGKPVMNTFTLGYDSFLVVRKGYKHPEALIKMINLYNKKYTEEYRTYGSDDKGAAQWRLSPLDIRDPLKNVNSMLAVKDALQSKDVSKLQGEQKAMYDNVDKFLKGDQSMWGWYKVFGPDGVGLTTEPAIKYMLDNHLYVQNKFVGAPTKTMVQANSTLSKLQEETYIKMIMEDKADEFDKFVNSWNKLGGEQITKEVNEWYDSIK
jgi:putative aldouronate transport system substrate-binding protein